MEKRKILISIVGKGQKKGKTEDFDYAVTEYQFDDGDTFKTKLVGHALFEKFKFEEVYIIGTSQSLWKVVDETIGKGNYEKIEIPFGRSEEEFWRIFEILTSLKVENSEIYFDITHGFRSIPIFISTLLNFFAKVKEATVVGVYYGIFEARKNNITPVVNILPLLEINRWIDSFYLFRKYGDGREIGDILNEKFIQIPDEDKKEYNYLKQLRTELELYSQSIGFSAVQLFQLSLTRINMTVDKIQSLPPNLKALKFLREDIKRESSIFKEEEKRWKKDFKTAELLFEKNRYSQSLTILRETLITYILEECGLEDKIFNLQIREEILGEILREEIIERKEKPLYFSKEFLSLVNKVKELRNKANHAFIREELVQERTIRNVIRKSVKELEEFLQEFRDLSQTDSILLNKMALKEEVEKQLKKNIN
jgi:CRISPR-associated DxTHG motif protein